MTFLMDFLNKRSLPEYLLNRIKCLANFLLIALNDIFEHLKDDKVVLYPCLLVNYFWCEVSVQILWADILNYNTLIACLPNESKEILHKNEIIVSIQTSKPPLFNYITFVKSLSMSVIHIKKSMLHQSGW